MTIEPALVAEHGFNCIECGKLAGLYQLIGTPNQASYISNILLGKTTFSVSGAAYFNLGIGLLSGDAKAIHKLDQEYMPCYCPKCDAIFCNDHWKIHVQFDDDGWRDSIRGMCPKGHKRMLED